MVAVSLQHQISAPGKLPAGLRLKITGLHNHAGTGYSKNKLRTRFNRITKYKKIFESGKWLFNNTI